MKSSQSHTVICLAKFMAPSMLSKWRFTNLLGALIGVGEHGVIFDGGDAWPWDLRVSCPIYMLCAIMFLPGFGLQVSHRGPEVKWSGNLEYRSRCATKHCEPVVYIPFASSHNKLFIRADKERGGNCLLCPSVVIPLHYIIHAIFKWCFVKKFLQRHPIALCKY